MRISDWSSDVCSSDLQQRQHVIAECQPRQDETGDRIDDAEEDDVGPIRREVAEASGQDGPEVGDGNVADRRDRRITARPGTVYGVAYRPHALSRKLELRPSPLRSEEHTSELQSLMRISYAVFCLK